jgi:outer membrane protein assembly complex protein YaeT
MTVRSLIFLLLFSGCCYGQQYYGTRVGQVELSGGETPSDVDVLGIHAGDVVTPENIRDAIQALYNTHHYSYIEVEGAPGNNGTRLIFRVRPIRFFSTFRLEPDDLLDRSLSGFLRLPYGEPFSQAVVDRLTSQAVTLLQNEGYFDATVMPRVVFEEPARLATVVFKVETKGRARVGSVHITGGEDTFPDRSKITDAFGLNARDEFTSDKYENGLRKIREKFANLPVGGFLDTHVDGQRNYRPDTNTVDLSITIQPGKFTLVEAIGYKITQTKLKELVPIYEEGSVDPDLVEEGRARIRSFMQQEGYFEAAVQSEVINATLDNAVQINYRIDKGEQHRIVEVRLQGNNYFTASEIKDRMKVHSGGTMARGAFSPEMLDTDRKTILSMYRNAGFQDAAVDGSFHEKDHQLTITVSIKEGDRIPISTFNFDGNEKVSNLELADRCGLHAGDLYTAASVEQARNALISMYYAKGFPDVQVDAEAEKLSAPKQSYRITFRVNEGDRYTIGQVLVAGSEFTAPKIVHRNANLYPDTPYNPEAILDSQQRLYATGLFNRVDIVPIQQDQPGIRDVLIEVEDAKRILFTYGFGYQEFYRARATIELSHINLFGLDRSITMRLTTSFRDQQIQSTYREPRLGNHNLEGSLSLLYDRSDLPLFKDTRLDGSLQIVRRFSPTQNLIFSSGYESINLQDIRVNPFYELYPDETGVVHISRVGTSYIRDNRDDKINATTGSFSTTTFQVATRRLGGDVNYTSLYNQSLFFWPLNKSVIATSVRLGWIHPYGVTKQAPITERFFAGGSTTLRGYNLDEAGPAGGGDAQTIGNVEYRFPMTWLPVKNFGGTFFYDTGNVFAKVSDISLTNFSHSAGAGIRYNTPLGPVRFDVGFNLRQAPIDVKSEKLVHYFFTLGHTF